MIFKYCTWPEEAKEADRATVFRNNESNSIQKDQNFNMESTNSRRREYKIASTVLRYCPCAFRCRQPVDVVKDEEDSISTIITTVNTTPVIPLRLSGSTDTIDKTVNENEYNEKNKHHFLPEDNFGDIVDLPFEAEDHELSSSDALENNSQQDIEQDIADTQDDSDSRFSSPERQDTAFDIITGQSSPLGRDTVDFIISLNETRETETKTAIDDNGSKDWSSEEEPKSRSQSRAMSRCSEHVTFIENNENDSEVASDETGRIDETLNIEEKSIVFALDSEPAETPENLETNGDVLYEHFQEAETSPKRKTTSPMKFTRPPSRNSAEYEELKSLRRDSGSSSQILNCNLEDKESLDSNEQNVASPIVRCDKDSTQSKEANEFHRESNTEEPPAIIIASRPHSSAEVTNFIENDVETITEGAENDNVHRFVKESSGITSLEDGQNRNSLSESNIEPGILKIEYEPPAAIATTKRKLSRVPRVAGRGRSKGNSDRIKPIMQQCFSQLESKEWEIIIKGLKTLSHIAKQQPEYLDVSATPTISRHLGRQIKSLRSQVARTACSTAGDIFGSQIRGIDQDFDEIAGPLLHRTADTNRFLRSDSNAALDRMIEHLPPHKTISVIILRGASHPNAIVRAATARLLASVVDRVGPVNILILPKDVKDKLLSTGARLLIDSNLDARNHAKRMFRRLAHCDGFRKALTDAVPETTLRHIDKTLKAL